MFLFCDCHHFHLPLNPAKSQLASLWRELCARFWEVLSRQHFQTVIFYQRKFCPLKEWKVIPLGRLISSPTIDDYGKDGGPHFTQCMIGICPLATHSYQNLQLQHEILTTATIDLGRRNFIVNSTLFLAVARNKVQYSFPTSGLLFASFHQDFKKIFGLVYMTDWRER